MSVVIFLMGPTASGKTDLAVELVERLPCEIISVDSAMVFRGMDIGTSKPGPEVLQRSPHRLIDIRDPAESYSAAQFRADALREIADIEAHGHIPLLVGGTMLYFRALQRGLSPLPSADAATRARLDAEARALGWPAMHARLAHIDPQAARRIHPNDPQRIQRALEVFEVSGKTLTQLCAQGREDPFAHRVLKIALAPPDRAVLHERIAMRFHRMLELGMIEEVRRLYERGDLSPELPAMRAVGYRQVWEYLDGRYDREEMERRAVYATRQLAKRQLTWLRSEADARWLVGPDPSNIDNILKYFRETISLDK